MAIEYIAVVVTILFTHRHQRAASAATCSRIFTAQRTWLDPILGPVERLVLRLTGVDPNEAAGLETVLGVAADLESVHVARHLDDRHTAAVPAAQS